MDKRELLKIFSQLNDTTEYEEEDIRSFLQVKQYRELQDPSKIIVVGGRGAGKTRVFKTLVGENGFRHVIGDSTPFNRPNYQNTKILIGYSVDTPTLPSPTVLDGLGTDAEISAFWVGATVLEILAYFKEDETIQTAAKIHFDSDVYILIQQDDILKFPRKWLPIYLSNPEPWESFLDEVDKILLDRDNWIFIAYDQIDRISTNLKILYVYIQSLVSYWFSVSNRRRRLKCKIFIRTDLLNSESIHFPDASKVSSRRIDLSWDTLTLYRLLIRRLANTQDEAAPQMLEYMDKIPGLLEKRTNTGYFPVEDKDIVRKFIQQLIGPYMGTSPKKGDSYLWVPNHLQDANGDLSPRSFLKCYSCAAQTMLSPIGEKMLLQLSDTALLNPSAIQGAVQEVSAYRVTELGEDFPWIARLKNVLSGGTLLMPEDEFKERLAIFLKNAPKDLPVESVDNLLNLLLSLGIITQSTDNRINMPEIYLHGFGLKRKGGLRRT